MRLIMHFDEINNFFMNNYWNKIGIFVKLMRKVSVRWRVRRGVQKNGWTPLASGGGRFSVSVDSGMEALTTTNAGEALSSWLSRTYMDGFLFYKKCGPVPGNR